MSTICDKSIKLSSSTKISQKSDSIERLQEKQGKFQKRLDEALEVAKVLATKKKRKLSCIPEDENFKNRDTVISDGEDEEDELVEFEEIENELKISDLKRQLDNVEKELRIKLYKRLLSNTNVTKCRTDLSQTNNSNNSHTKSTESNQKDEPHVGVIPEPDDQTHQIAQSDESKNINTDKNSDESNSNSDLLESALKVLNKLTDRLAEHKVSSSTANRDVSDSSTKSYLVNNKPTEKNIYSDPTDNESFTVEETSLPSSSSQSSVLITPEVYTKNSPPITDLHRIEEDEESCNDHYSNSDYFRSIYEEKFSSVTYGLSAVNRKYEQNQHQLHQKNSTSEVYEHLQLDSLPMAVQHLSIKDEKHVQENSFRTESIQNNSPSIFDCSNNSNFSTSTSSTGKRSLGSSRPLTLYLPKPDEEIDLLDHIQALGHDLNTIAPDLTVDSGCAQGYIWKCCSNNNKKWLRRYFFFDRNAKVLSYYENKEHQMKKHSSPRNLIPFNDIIDVYVDHKMSSMGEKDGSTKRNYVFVLVTAGRKYMFALSKAETMRAWIDVLFTAAQANEYYQKLTDIETDMILIQ